MDKKSEIQDCSKKNITDIGMAVEFVRDRVKDFNNIPEKVVPNFSITKEEIDYLEKCMERTILENSVASSLNMGDGYIAFFKDSVRFGLNCMLIDENHPAMKRYLKEMKTNKSFLQDLVKICEKHGLSLAHEDY